MALMTIKSSNKDLSWVLCKNPESGIMSRKIRQGFGYGWFGQDIGGEICQQTYHMLFKEDFDCDSFGDSGFSYLSKDQYSNPFAYNCLVTTLIKDVLKNVSPKDVKALQKVQLHQVYFKGYRLLEQLKQHLPVDMEYKETRKFTFEITFTGNCTLHHMMTCVSLVGLYLGGDTGARLTKLDEAFMVKYAKMINSLNLPYFLRYVFARNFFRDRNTFNKNAPMIETDSIKLAHGDTAMQRFRYIEKQLDMTLPILDLGCGEGLYALNLSKRTPFTYHAVDIDTELTEAVYAKGQARGLDIKTYNHIDEYEHSYGKNTVDIIFTEVIEHMPLEDAKDLFKKVLKMDFRKLIITTPDKDFNVNYGLGEDFRHDDHDWEMTGNEFSNWVTDILQEHQDETGQYFERRNVGIGDCVDGVYTSQGFIIENTEVQPQAIITVGCSASGKSTFAEKLTKLGWTEINRDTIRFRGREKNWNTYNWKHEGAVTRKWEKKLHNAISNNENIVISDTNLNVERTEKLIATLEESGYQVTIKKFDVPFEELLKRDNHRQGGVGYEVLLMQYRKLQQDWNGVDKYQPNELLPSCYVVDLDGTLFEANSRNIFDYTKVLSDAIIPHTIKIVDSLLESGTKVVFLSGREGTEQCLQDTRKALGNWLGEKQQDCPLIMREVGDLRKDSIFKMEMFDKYIRNQYNVLAVMDDRKQVIEECWNVLEVNVINVGKPEERF